MTYEERTRLFETNYSLACSLADAYHRKTQKDYIAREDYQQEALKTLWNCTGGYDCTKQSAFTTYAYTSINRNLRTFYNRMTYGSLARSSTLQEALKIIKDVKISGSSVKKYCKSASISRCLKEIVFLADVNRETPASLSYPMACKDYDDDDMSNPYVEYICDSEEVEEETIQNIYSSFLFNKLFIDFVEEALHKCWGKTVGTRRALYRLFLCNIFSGRKVSQEEYGKIFSISHQTVSNYYRTFKKQLAAYLIEHNELGLNIQSRIRS